MSSRFQQLAVILCALSLPYQRLVSLPHEKKKINRERKQKKRVKRQEGERMRGIVLAVAMALAIAAVSFVGRSVTDKRHELLGNEDEWIAREDGMALDLADESAKRSH